MDSYGTLRSEYIADDTIPQFVKLKSDIMTKIRETELNLFQTFLSEYLEKSGLNETDLKTRFHIKSYIPMDKVELINLETDKVEVGFIVYTMDSRKIDIYGTAVNNNTYPKTNNYIESLHKEYNSVSL